MRRFSFYALISLSAFAVGSLATYDFYQKFKNKPTDGATTEKLVQSYPNRKPWERPWKNSYQPAAEKKIAKEPFCENKRILPVWKELVKDKSFRQRTQSQTGEESFDCADMLEIKEADLNRDGQKEIILRGKNFNLCSAVGNCAFWIYQKRRRKYKKILDSTDYADATKMPNEVENDKTNGYFDILLKSHITAGDTGYDFYKFDGASYKHKKCQVSTPVLGTSENPKWEFIGCRKFYKRWEDEQKNSTR